jgi:hypothetical protein
LGLGWKPGGGFLGGFQGGLPCGLGGFLGESQDGTDRTAACRCHWRLHVDQSGAGGVDGPSINLGAFAKGRSCIHCCVRFLRGLATCGRLFRLESLDATRRKNLPNADTGLFTFTSTQAGGVTKVKKEVVPFLSHKTL